MVLFSLIPIVSATVDWVRPENIADSLYGMLIYDGNINITFDGDFTINGGGTNDTDTNESIRFENLTDYDCPPGYLVIGVYDNGTVRCAADADTNASSVCSDNEVLLGNGSCYPTSNFGGADTDTNLSSGGIIYGNLTIADTYYLEGQPLDGSIGSGIIYASSHTTKCGCINISDAGGLNVTYPDLIVRIVDSKTNKVTYCNITSSTVTAPDNTHTVYYVDNTCTVQTTPFNIYFNQDLSPSDYCRIFDIKTYNGVVESGKGASILNIADRKRKWVDVDISHLNVMSGMILTEDTFPAFNISSGTYRYIDTEVNSFAVSSIDNGTHLIGYSGEDVTYFTGTGINLTACTDGTDVANCPDNSYRRYLIGTEGWGEHSNIYQFIPHTSDDTFNTLAECMNLGKYPLVFNNLADSEKYAFVKLYAYCGKRDDSSWRDGWINIDGGGGVAGNIDTSNFLTRDGTTTLTANWDTGAYTITMEGELILEAMATVQNITFDTHNLYKIGNSTHWLKELYATTIYNKNLYTNFVNASEINTTDINSDNINSTTMEVNENITLGNHILRKDENDLAIVLD